MNVSPIRLKSCPKNYTLDLDKARSPEETFADVSRRLKNSGLDIFAGARRVDCGRLGIPVYLGLCGQDAREVLPTRKQMGKGSSAAQARASALMEVMERYAFFSFFERRPNFARATWQEAENLFGQDLIGIDEMRKSVNDPVDPETARAILNLRSWDFYPATRLADGKIVWLPLDWFRMLGEFNGSSAGNSAEESILQGISELLERHCCCLAERERPILPTIAPSACKDPVLAKLVEAFRREGILLILKDFSQGLPMPCVAALAHDPATFPEKSEIVFTAGTASSPAKAAIRAITEVAQLGGDFCTSSCYEASGLPKFTSPDQFHWLMEGPVVSLDTLPDISSGDILEEISRLVHDLAPTNVYAVETANPDLAVPAHYCIAPGLAFRERDRNQSIGLFTGRKLAEEGRFAAIEELARLCPNAHYLPFFRGMLALGAGDCKKAAEFFAAAAPLQPDDESRALAMFYNGHAKTLMDDWGQAIPELSAAFRLCPSMKEYGNLLGVALFKTGSYPKAEEIFGKVLNIDKGSAMDLANRGICRKLQGKNEAALEDLRAALELEPDLDFARRHLEELTDNWNIV